MIGIVLGLAVLVVLCVKKVHIVVASLAATLVVCLLNGMSFYTELTGDYIEGFGSFVMSWFLVFFAGAFFGKMMELSGSAQAVANALIKAFGPRYALIAVPIVVGLLCYGGVNGFVVVFAVWPLLDKIFRQLDKPRRLMPAWFQFGAGTFSNCGPGTPSSLNLVTTGALGVGPAAGFGIGMVSVVVNLVLGTALGMWLFKRADKRGEHYLAPGAVDFSYADQAKENEERVTPNVLIAILPLVVTVVSLNITIGGEQVVNNFYAILLGAVVCAVLNYKTIGVNNFVSGLGESVTNGLGIVCATSAITGFGTVVKATTAFQNVVEMIPNMPGSPLITLFLATNVMCAITGTATGAAGMVAPILGDIYLKMGIPAATIARTIVVSGVGFDSVPHNGGIVNYIFGFAHEDYKSAYPAVFLLSVVVPCIAALACIAAAYLFGVAG